MRYLNGTNYKDQVVLMKEKIEKRFKDLIEKGENIERSLPRVEGTITHWIDKADITSSQAWLNSTVNLINIVGLTGGTYIKESQKLLDNEDNKIGIPCMVLQKMLGILISASDEWNRGFNKKVEYIVIAKTFDDFLDFAQTYHKANKTKESSTLVSTVLEDTIKKIAKKNDLETKDQPLEPLIDKLVKANVFNQTDSKQVKVYTDIRNNAFHARWEKIDIKAVGSMIKGVRELIKRFIAS